MVAMVSPSARRAVGGFFSSARLLCSPNEPNGRVRDSFPFRAIFPT
jgi:hypothetical protein